MTGTGKTRSDEEEVPGCGRSRRHLIRLWLSALAAAEAQRVPMPAASLVRDHFISAIARDGEMQDWSALARVAAENAGIRPGSGTP